MFRRRNRKRAASIIERAASNDVQGVADLCKKKRSSLSDSDGMGRTAIHAAAKEGHGGLVSLLLGMQADPNRRDMNGLTALHHACGNQTNQFMDIVKYLLADGNAQPTAITNDGNSALHLLVQRDYSDLPEFLALIELIISNGSEINIQNSNGDTVLHQIAKSGRKELVSYFLAKGAALDLPTRNGETPLHVAIRCNNTEIAKLLLQKGANPKARALDGTISEYCDTYNMSGLCLETEEQSYAYQARLVKEKTPGKPVERMEINLQMVRDLEEKGYESSSIIAAMYTLHRINLPIDDPQLVINEITNGMQSAGSECCVCFDAPVNSLLLPCRHVSLCMECANCVLQTQGSCPMCTTTIAEVLEVFI